MKLEKSNLFPYFQTIVISENVGINKPDPAIFDYAVSQSKTKASASIMIGDNLDADVRGAQNYGMDAIFFNSIGAEKPNDVPHMIKDLKELQKVF